MLQSGCRFGVVYASALEQIRPGFAREMLPNLKSEWEQLDLLGLLVLGELDLGLH
jgi:hypothetical protein